MTSDQQTAPAKVISRKIGKGMRKMPARIPANMRRPVMKRAANTAQGPYLEHLLGIIELLRKPGETPQETIDEGGAAVPAQQEATTGACCGPCDGGKDRRQDVDLALIGEKTGKQQHR